MSKIFIKKKSDNNDNISPENVIKDMNIETSKYKLMIINDNLYNFLVSSTHICLKFGNIILKVSGIYLLWICLHYFSAHLYIKFCVPDTIFGFLMSPFMIATPHCQGLRWIVYNAAGIINNMWILIGTWIYSLIWIFKRENNLESTTL